MAYINGKKVLQVVRTEGVAVNVQANPSGTATETLEKLLVDETIYSVDGGSSTPDNAMSDSSVNAVQNKVIKKYVDDKADTKANVDGYYSSMSVGLSDNFNTNMTTEDKSPYNFRTSGGALEIANQCKEKAIVGGSVVLNQLVQNGNFENTNNWTTAFSSTFSVANNKGTITATEQFSNLSSSNISFVASHKYLLNIDFNTSVSNWYAYILKSSNPTAYILSKTAFQTSGNKLTTIFTTDTSVASKLTIQYDGSTASITSDTKIVVGNINVIDLTQKFGSTIADYIYTLETGQAGAGVAWFRKYFPKPYYTYNTGSFLNVKTSGKKVIGFNQFNTATSTDGKGMGSSGSTYDSPTNFVTDYIRVVPNNAIYLNPTNWVYWVNWYDYDKNYISQTSRNINNLITPPSNAVYGRFTGILAQKDTACINLHWDGERDGEYEPYEETTYPIEDVELRGIPKLDSNNELYFDGDVYNADGSVDENYELVDLSTLTWNRGQGNIYSDSLASVIKANAYGVMPDIFATKYPTTTTNNSYVGAISLAYTGAYVDGRLFVYVDNSETADLPTGYLLYKKATPTTTSATPFTEVQNVSNWGTEEFLDNRDVPMPVGHITEYLPDLKAKLETAPESPEDDGYYVMKRDNGENSYSLLSTWLTSNGYVVPTSITGYDATKTQVLKNVEGVLTWVDEEV